MATYLLLRNNKETGPYSLEELSRQELKAYDLIWVNGRSAAWRYPSEIEELKPFAPPAAEQPYDRFFKKKTTEKTVEQVAEEKVVEKTGRIKLTPAVSNPPERNLAQAQNPLPAAKQNKQVYVAMPGKGKVTTSQTEPLAKKTPEPAVEKYGPRPEQEKPVYEEPVNESAGLPEEDKVVRLEKRFSQPLDEIKELYVQTLVDRKKKIARKSIFKQGLKKVSVFAYVLILGVLIGLAIDQFSGDKPVIAGKSTPVKSETAIKNSGLIIPDARQAKGAQPHEVEIKENEEQQKLIDQQAKKKESGKILPGADSNDIAVLDGGITRDETGGTRIDPVTGERTKATREDDEESGDDANVNSPSKQSLLKQVSVKANEYKTGPFGGVRDLELTLANKSPYQLDKVEVEVKYLGIEKKVVKTQKMVFNDITPGGTARIEVPRSNRGITVECVVTKINAKDTDIAQNEP